ncbi:MAG: DUF2442 domain-containing protein [Acidobacteria bacterium]|nr:DUF2442 domain-containing protein [Acidobacteriota bacterium]
MRSALLGKRTSVVEVTNISRSGFWLLLQGRELFISFRQFPWFKKAPVDQLLNVRLPGENHLYWPELDVDLAVESIEHPERFPLVSKARPRSTVKRTARRR